MKMNIKSLLVGLAISASLVGCGGSSGGGTSTTVSGVALKADGTVFAKGSTVLVVDAVGNTGSGTVTNDTGSYLVSVASSGKKEKAVTGNKFLNVTDGTNSMNLVIPNDQSTVNFNAVTGAASQLIINKTGTNLTTIFAAVKTASASPKQEKAVSNQAILDAIAAVEAITKADFKLSSTTVVGALFGLDSDGKSPLDIDKLLSGDSTSKEVVLLKAAAKIKGATILADIVTATNNPSNTTFLLNDPLFFKAVGVDLAADTAVKGSATEFSDFLNSVVKSTKLLDALKTLTAALDAFLTAEETTKGASFTVDIKTATASAVVAPAKVSIAVTRASADTVGFTITGGKAGDTTYASMAVISGSSVEAVVSLSLSSADGLTLTPGATSIVVTNGTVSVAIAKTASISGNTVNLKTALAEAIQALKDAGQTSLAAKIPTTSTGLTLAVSSTPVVRSGVDFVNTFIVYGSTTASSIAGVTLN